MSPTPPAWSRWMCVTTIVARSSGPTPSSASARTTRSAERAVPVSTRQGRLLRMRYPEVMPSYPPMRVSIWKTSSPRVSISSAIGPVWPESALPSGSPQRLLAGRQSTGRGHRGRPATSPGDHRPMTATPVPPTSSADVVLVGRLGTRVDLRDLPSGDTVTVFTVVVDRPTGIRAARQPGQGRRHCLPGLPCRRRASAGLARTGGLGARRGAPAATVLALGCGAGQRDGGRGESAPALLIDRASMGR